MAILREGTSGEPVKRLQGDDRRRVRRKCGKFDASAEKALIRRYGLRELAKAL